jgi:hypothetical protein
MKKYNTKVSRSGYFRILKNKKIQKNKYPYSDDKFKIQKETLKKLLTECKKNVISINETSVFIGDKPNYGISKKGRTLLYEGDKQTQKIFCIDSNK